MTISWRELPQEVRAAVERHIGTVTDVVEVAVGQSSDLLAVLTATDGRRVFCKGVRGISKRMRWLRNEIVGSRVAAGIAPEVLFHEDVEADADWLVVGYAYLPGRRADLSPGSSDLAAVAGALERIRAKPAMDLRPLRERWSGTAWWTRLADERPDAVHGWDVAEMTRLSAPVPTLVDGDRLLHTDLHADQFVVADDGSVHVVDWGYPGAGAPWVDAAFMTLRLVDAGHPPSAVQAWTRADPETLTAFACYVAGFWTHLAVAQPGPGTEHRARLALEYLRWRLEAPRAQ
ncbi:hypothetical protein [Actinokineospora sp. NBRC 105648]|uniref:hypothetical protein n=1 Tax=Actinokineospora sp. NBRC 105648 TaxID=3032206 RepID=UPI0024A4214F|nr:hypothetical protein [Actinokineospora sp. NBRC 105648]GLZ43299.1 hypothetical protein Acsp05_69230 [Actinokineospora sp. NBRC 105648]